MLCGKLSPCVHNIYLLKSDRTYIVFQHYAAFRQKLYFDGRLTWIPQNALMRNSANYHH